MPAAAQAFIYISFSSYKYLILQASNIYETF